MSLHWPSCGWCMMRCIEEFDGAVFDITCGFIGLEWRDEL